ncbi:hypothetical protein [Halobacillus trueperi]|uniref:hypothetical protein n=1 Tax=Halobacillus trueperi TaxID=156205 RepID=UPI003736751F
MKILTYENPYKITSTSYWPEIASFPHLCVSQTLLEGMKNQYGRDAFWYIDTIERFEKDFYEPWTNHPENEIKQFLSITEHINQVESENLRKALKFNQKEVHQALRFLTELKLSPDNFDKESLTDVQKIFLDFFIKLKGQEQWSILNELDTLSIEDLKDSFLTLLNNELEKELEQSNLLKGRAKREADKKIKYIESIFKEYTNSIDSTQINGIVIHGVHQFNPLLLRLIHHFESMGIEVIFLINYQNNYRNIYYTWDKVYRWTNEKFRIDKNENIFASLENNLGKGVGSLLEGDIQNWDFRNITFNKYDNLTTFADEIASKFETASINRIGEKVQGNASGALSRMEEQFYASDNEEVNNLLQAYFPEQFGERHFLSYPIGQFILGLYNMWDENERTLKINSSILKECLSVNFFKIDNQPTPLEIYNKIELYFKDIDNIIQFKSRLNDLIDIIRKIEISSHLEFNQELKVFSFFNVTSSELEYFNNVIHDLYEITRQVFGNNKDGYINYKKHYKTLIEIILKKTNSPMVNAKEKELVESLYKQFTNVEELEVEGAMEDLKESIHFYLNRRDSETSANWIVRNFEQIDGGVLLSRSGRAKKRKYHLAMLSDQKMKVSLSDRLSWPLTRGFFDSYKEDVTNLEIVLGSLSEYGNFLRYSLFYATYYLENEIILSYVENSEGEKDTPYFLLKMLGIEAEMKDVDQKSLSPFLVGKETDSSKYGDDIDLPLPSSSFETVELQKKVTCSYRYLLDHVIEDGGYFHNEYHCKLYYKSILYKNALLAILKENQEDNYKECVRKINKELSDYFPFWRNIDFYDVEVTVNNYVRDQLKSKKRDDPNYYLELRLNFLYASITEGKYSKGGDNLIKSIHHLREGYKDKRNQVENDIISYLEDERQLMDHDTNPLICDYCKQRDICLYHAKASGGSND